MSLGDLVHLRTPLIWLQTTEFDRYTDEICYLSDVPVYKLDPFQGLSVWDADQQRWLICIVDVPNPLTGEVDQRPVFQLQAAVGVVLERSPAIFLVYFADKMVEDFLPLFAGTLTQYRRAWWEDKLEDLPIQFVLITPSGEIPPELANHAAVVNAPLPSPEELAEVVSHLEQTAQISLEAKEKRALVQAGGGLTEAEFAQVNFLTLKHKQTLDATVVHNYKHEKIKAGGILEIRRPSMSLDDIGGLDYGKKLIDHVTWMWENPHEAAALKLRPLRRFLMVGIPGTGKSAICEATASSLGVDLAKTGVSQAMNRFIGQSEANIRAIFAQIKAMSPIVVWMDELGRDLSSPDYEGDAGTTSRVHGEFLTGLQELPEDVFLMAAANRIDRVAPEMLRADRFDKILFVGFPTHDERMQIFRIHLGENAAEFDLDRLASATYMFTGAEIKTLIIDARFSKSMTGVHEPINTDDIVNTVPNMRNRFWLKHQQAAMSMYAKALEEWDWASSQQRIEAEDILSGVARPQPNKVVKTSNRSSFTSFGS